MKYPVAVALALVALAGVPLSAQSGGFDLAAIDKLRNFDAFDLACKITVLNKESDGDERTTEARYYRRDREEKFSMIITAPMSDMGQGYLMIGDNLLFYDPDTRATTHRTIKDSFQGSKARNDDFTSASFATDYRVVKVADGMIKDMPVKILDIQARNDLVPYARQRLWVRADLPLILKQECYGVSNKLMVSYVYPKYVQIKGSYVPEKIFVRDEIKKGESSEITLRSISVDPLPAHYFTEAFLETNGR